MAHMETGLGVRSRFETIALEQLCEKITRVVYWANCRLYIEERYIVETDVVQPGSAADAASGFARATTWRCPLAFLLQFVAPMRILSKGWS